MASTTTERESALRASLLAFLRDMTLGMESALDIDRAIANAFTVVRHTIAEFARESNRTRPSVLWNRIPAELKLATARCLPLGQREKMLQVSGDIREFLLSDTSLWTNISYRQTIDKDAVRGEYLDAMLARSGSRPLELEWRYRCVPAPRAFRPDPVRGTVLRVLPRVKTLVLDSTYFPSGVQGTFWTTETPVLESLTITDQHENYRNSRIASPSWSGISVPRLRDIRLGDVFFEGPPLEPLASVLHLEARMPGGRNGWEHIWAWFPRLESLTVYVQAPLPIPEPPSSLRHVRLHGTDRCTSPTQVMRDWSASHHVRLLEIFSAAGRPLRTAAEFLNASDSEGPWSAFFVYTLGAPSYAARARPRSNKILGERIETLTLSHGAIGAVFTGRFVLPALRSLTLVNGEMFVPLLSNGDTLSATALEELIIEVASAAHAEKMFPHIPPLVTRIQHGKVLREIVIRLSDALDKQSPEIAKLATELAPSADIVRFEYCPAHRFRQDPCPDIYSQL
ncbi:hypothetical protein AURDEDRAFT_175834 [Auricularia subglabra TFB-10046 SS5]|uniref:Uncharacterized protein n=1 Tax=Auricularia subglabra (strain TFB-10046 / SS5) TaxID=717982 RepID=J0CWP8_AURST|nr:hypothetical protein AURDEDRAFT_175834 [Auricularia subglabra TFB-10046 SS5]